MWRCGIQCQRVIYEMQNRGDYFSVRVHVGLEPRPSTTQAHLLHESLRESGMKVQALADAKSI